MNRFVFFLVIGLWGSLGAWAKSPYPHIDSTYSRAACDSFYKNFLEKRDTVGIAYTYVAYTKLPITNQQLLEDIYKGLLMYYTYIKPYSMHDYLRIKLVIADTFNVDNYSRQKSLVLYQEVIDAAKTYQFNDIRLSAIFSKTYIMSFTNEDAAYAFMYREINPLLPILKTLKQGHQYEYYLARRYFSKRDLQNALYYFKKSLELSLEKADNEMYAVQLLYIGKIYREKKEYKQALQWLEKGLKNSDKYNELKRWAYEEIALVYDEQKNYRLANLYWNKYYEYQLLNREQSYRSSYFNSLLLKNLEDELKNKQERLLLQNKIANKEIESNNILIRGGTIGIFLLVVLLVFISLYFFQRQRNFQIVAQLRFLQGQEQEREAISQELHDNVGGTLVAIKNAIPDFIPNYSLINSQLNDVYAIIRQTSYLLNSESIRKVGLIESCRGFIQLIDKERIVSFQVFGAENALSHLEATSAFRIIQELLQNAIRHANAHRIYCSVYFEETSLLINIEDDGIGFDKQNRKGLGLRNIEKRVKLMEGSIELDTTPNEGTSVWVSLPNRGII